MLASDVVMAVLVHMDQDHFDGTPLQIHAAFRKVAQEHQELFRGFTFGRPGGPVSSYAVEVGLDNLATAGMLSVSNPRLIRHTLHDAAGAFFDEELRDSFDEAGFNEDRLREVASQFSEALSSVRESGNEADLLILS